MEIFCQTPLWFISSEITSELKDVLPSEKFFEAIQDKETAIKIWKCIPVYILEKNWFIKSNQ